MIQIRSPARHSLVSLVAAVFLMVVVRSAPAQQRYIISDHDILVSHFGSPSATLFLTDETFSPGCEPPGIALTNWTIPAQDSDVIDAWPEHGSPDAPTWPTSVSIADELASDLGASQVAGRRDRLSHRLAAETRDLAIDILRDSRRAYLDWHNLAILGVAAGGAIAIREGGWDEDVRRYTAEHPDRWGKANDPFNLIGEMAVHWPAIGLLYGYSLFHGDPYLYETSRSLIVSVAITGISTTIIKLATDTARPTSSRVGGHYGFPSYHTAAAFTMAAVIDEYYGPLWGAFSYTTAGIVGWTRIDEREHDLSDVVFGAALGYVIGHSVSGIHRRGDARVYLLPFRHPLDDSTGLAAEWRY